MKGTIFQRPLELNIVIDGESWRQGSHVRGRLTVKDHGGGAELLKGMHVTLAYASLKDAQANKPDAFETVGRVDMLPEGGEWHFELEPNCPITDRSASLYIIYGSGDDTTKLGRLQLNVHPAQVIEDFVESVKVQHKFVLKQQKSRKGWVETKLSPPSSKAFSVVELLALSCRFKGEDLEVGWLFTMKKLDAAAGMQLKKDQREFEQRLAPTDYRTASGRFNHERVEASVLEVLGQLGLGAPLG